MRPSKNLLNAVLCWCGLGLLVFILRVFDTDNVLNLQQVSQSLSGSLGVLLLWKLSGLLLLLVSLIDYVKHRHFNLLVVQRTLPHSLALGVPTNVDIRLENPYPFTLKLDFTDFYPRSVQCTTLPISLEVEPDSTKTFSYTIVPLQRGEATFDESCLRIQTPWTLWQKLHRHKQSETIKIYPNFAPIVNSASIGLEHQIAQLGVHLQQRRGEGSDFHQLREFREGDSLRQIDWKATARQRKPISREYQDERDQDIIFLLDCGRRLRAKDGDISHFDHALNALLLTSYVALRQGDAVGLMSFAGEDRWLSPQKGPARINHILNHLYDLHSSTVSSDFLQAAEDFLSRYTKRSLIIIVTNVWEEDTDDLLAAINLLTKKHIVLIANLRENYLDDNVQEAVNSFNQALTYCSTIDHLKRRRTVFAKLKNSGAIIADSLPHYLYSDLVNEYLKLKRSGRL